MDTGPTRKYLHQPLPLMHQVLYSYDTVLWKGYLNLNAGDRTIPFLQLVGKHSILQHNKKVMPEVLCFEVHSCGPNRVQEYAN